MATPRGIHCKMAAAFQTGHTNLPAVPALIKCDQLVNRVIPFD